MHYNDCTTMKCFSELIVALFLCVCLSNADNMFSKLLFRGERTGCKKLGELCVDSRQCCSQVCVMEPWFEIPLCVEPIKHNNQTEAELIKHSFMHSLIQPSSFNGGDVANKIE